jgi:hypothetical protein
LSAIKALLDASDQRIIDIASDMRMRADHFMSVHGILPYPSKGKA